LSRLSTRDLAVAALFTTLLAVSSFIVVPIGTVPLTLQVYVVVLAGIVLGPRLGGLSVVAYLLLGLATPVYSGGASGVGVLLGPTGGYLVGFVAAAVLTGLIAGGPGSGVPRLLFAGLAAVASIYVLGAAWLALQLDLTPTAALAGGVAPFIWADFVKIVAAALTARALVSLPLVLPAASRRAH
jgi:biotin transport system substrate-specific component